MQVCKSNWKYLRPLVCWGVSEVSGVLSALLITSQCTEETPGITSWVAALSCILPSPSAVRGARATLVFCTTAKGVGALLTPAYPSLPPKPWPRNHSSLWVQHMEPSAQGVSQTLSPLVGLQQATAFWPSTFCSFLKGM